MVYFSNLATNAKGLMTNASERLTLDVSRSTFIMRSCEICGKSALIQKSGAHQYGGGWAMRATKKRAVWGVNLHSAKVTYNGVRKTMRLCTKCLRRVKDAMKKKLDSKKGKKFIETHAGASIPVSG